MGITATSSLLPVGVGSRGGSGTVRVA
jgi:hypothetical protein